MLDVFMASKITYWKCVECNSMINDENMIMQPLDDRSIDLPTGNELVEFCYGCHTYSPQVVVAYA